MATEILISPIDQAAATPALPLQPAATAGSTRKWGWMATTARAVGGACLHVLESPAAGTLIFTSVSLLLVWQQKKTKTRRPARPLTRSMSIGMLQGGDKAMRRFKLCHDAIHDEAKLKAAVDDMRRELHKPQIDFAELYACVGVVEISGKEKEAIELLEDALKRQKAEHTHEIHELELLLVEMNIYQGNYQKALNYPCMKADDVSSADARVHLYQAVIYTMLNDEKRARESYKKMREIRSGFHGPKFYKEGSSMSLDVADFNEFAKLAKRLVQEIQEAQSGTPAAKAQESQQEPVAAVKRTEEKSPEEPGADKKADEKPPEEPGAEKKADEKSHTEPGAEKKADEKSPEEPGANKKADEKPPEEPGAEKKAEEKSPAEPGAKKKVDEKLPAELTSRKDDKLTAVDEKLPVELTSRKDDFILPDDKLTA